MERKTAVPVNTGTQVQIDPNKIPGYVAHNIAQVLHKSIWEAWNDPVIRAEYERWDAVKNTTATIWNNVSSTISNKINAAKTSVSTVFNSIKTTISTVLNSIKTTVSTIFENVKTTITSKITAAKNTVKSIIDAIKGFFNFKFKWPSIPMPHFSINPSGWRIGDLLKGSIPSLGINWYAKGGILDGAQVFGAANGKLLGGGEAGKEAVLPLSELWKQMRSIIGEAMTSIRNDDRIAVLTDRLDALMAGNRADPLQSIVDHLTGDQGGKVQQGDSESYQITYAPTFQFYGAAPTKEDMVDAGRMSQDEFNDMMEEWIKQRKRLSFA